MQYQMLNICDSEGCERLLTIVLILLSLYFPVFSANMVVKKRVISSSAWFKRCLYIQLGHREEKN